MILAVLTLFILVSGIVIYVCIKGAVEVDENCKPVTNTINIKKARKRTGKTKSMVFHNFSSSRSIA